jgi:hypothetical protein
MKSTNDEWIGVDFDGTLATYEKPWTPGKLGEPIEAMVDRVKVWLKQGQAVKIFTARVSHDGTAAGAENCEKDCEALRDWCQRVFDTQLELTNVKDYKMISLWDDCCVAVEHNTGKILGGELRVRP